MTSNFYKDLKHAKPFFCPICRKIIRNFEIGENLQKREIYIKVNCPNNEDGFIITKDVFEDFKDYVLGGGLILKEDDINCSRKKEMLEQRNLEQLDPNLRNFGGE